MAISSLIYKIIGSKNLHNPLEIPLFLEKDLAKPENKKNIINATKIIDVIFLVIEKSIGAKLRILLFSS
jgi:hypothetical protein